MKAFLCFPHLKNDYHARRKKKREELLPFKYWYLMRTMFMQKKDGPLIENWALCLRRIVKELEKQQIIIIIIIQN
jgi:hypothetical protein